MVVLKPCYLMLFFFITQLLYRSYGGKNNDIEKLKETFLKLNWLATGYSIQTRHKYDQFKSVKTVDGLKLAIENLYDELECGYLFSAQLHLKLTGDMIFYKSKNVLTSETINDILFDKEATMMIYSLLDVKMYRVNNLWLLLMYTRQISVFFRHIVNDSTLNLEIIEANKQMHNYVLSQIENHLGRCESDNYYNMESEKREHLPFARKPSLKKKLTFRKTVQSFGTNNDKDGMKAIRANKHLLNRDFKFNRNKERLEFPVFESFPFHRLLLFHEEETSKSFFDEFLASDSPGFDIQFPKLGNGFMGIKELGEYQHRVIGAIELIMLEITLSYTNQLSVSGEILEHAVTFDDEILGKFMDIMLLNQENGTTLVDVDFKRVYDEFKYYYTALFLEPNYDDDFEKHKLKTNESIEQLINDIPIIKKLPQIRSIVTDGVQSETLHNIFTIGKRFVDKIQTDIGINSIRLVQSFLKMIDEKSEDF